MAHQPSHKELYTRHGLEFWLSEQACSVDHLLKAMAFLKTRPNPFLNSVMTIEGPMGSLTSQAAPRKI
jgi:hypothetical protein